MDVKSPSGSSSSTSSSSGSFPLVARAASTVSTASENPRDNLSAPVRKGSVGDRHDPDLAKILKETFERETEPVRIAVIGKRGVGKSTWVNSVRKLKPTDSGAAKVGADEVVTTENNRYMYNGLLLHDIPGAEGSTVEESMGEEYINRFELHAADACVLMYEKVIDRRLLECAHILDKKYTRPVFLVRNKVGSDCRNELSDGNARTLHEAFEKIRTQAQAQIGEDEKYKQFACKERLFLIESKYVDAVAAEPKEDFQEEFHRLKAALQDNILAEAKRAQLKALFADDVKGLAAQRAAACRRQELLLTVSAAAAAANPLPGLSSAGVMGVANLTATHFLKQFCLTEELTGIPELNILSKEVLARVTLMSVPALSIGVALDCLDVFPGVGLIANSVVGSTLAAAMMHPVFEDIIVKLEKVSVEVYQMAMDKGLHAERLQKLVDEIFNEAPEGQATDASQLQVVSGDGAWSPAISGCGCLSSCNPQA